MKKKMKKVKQKTLAPHLTLGCKIYLLPYITLRKIWIPSCNFKIIHGHIPLRELGKDLCVV